MNNDYLRALRDKIARSKWACGWDVAPDGSGAYRVASVDGEFVATVPDATNAAATALVPLLLDEVLRLRSELEGRRERERAEHDRTSPHIKRLCDALGIWDGSSFDSMAIAAESVVAEREALRAEVQELREARARADETAEYTETTLSGNWSAAERRAAALPLLEQELAVTQRHLAEALDRLRALEAARFELDPPSPNQVPGLAGCWILAWDAEAQAPVLFAPDPNLWRHRAERPYLSGFRALRPTPGPTGTELRPVSYPCNLPPIKAP